MPYKRLYLAEDYIEREAEYDRAAHHAEHCVYGDYLDILRSYIPVENVDLIDQYAQFNRQCI